MASFALRVTSPDVELRAVDGDTARVRVHFELRAPTDAEADELFERSDSRSVKSPGRPRARPSRSAAPAGSGRSCACSGMGSGRIDASISAEVPAGAASRLQRRQRRRHRIRFPRPAGVSAPYRATSSSIGSAGRRARPRLSPATSASAPTIRCGLEMNTVSGDVSAFAPRFEKLRPRPPSAATSSSRGSSRPGSDIASRRSAVTCRSGWSAG